jgi:hypothetical protein
MQLVVAAATQTTTRGGVLQIVVAAGGGAGSSGGGGPRPRCGGATAFGRRAERRLDPWEVEGEASRAGGGVGDERMGFENRDRAKWFECENDPMAVRWWHVTYLYA